MSLYFLTPSRDKFLEIKNIIPAVEQLETDLPEIQELDAHKIIESKLQEAQNRMPGAYIAEDTSLYFDALGSLPGPLVKWFVKTVGNEGLYKMAHMFDNSSAQARTILGYANEAGVIEYFEGFFDGYVVPPRGTSIQYGWDPIFQPRGSDKTFGEMTPEEKNKFSMRRVATEKLRDYLAAPPAPAPTPPPAA
jgi:inosine triphosphate pyrophosphatase